jgi:cell division protein FtsW
MKGPSSLGENGGWARGDGFLLIVVGILLTLGLLMIYSASAAVAESRHGNAAYFVKRQALWAVLGLGALAVGSGIDYHRWRRAIVPLTLGVLLLLVTVLIAGWTVNGSRRWIRVGAMSIQPSELARVVFIVYLAHYLAKRAEVVASFRGLAPALIVLGAGIGLIWLEPDLGNAAVLGLVAGGLLLLGGCRVAHLASLAGLMVPLVAFAVMGTAYQRRRWTAFLDPWADPSRDGFQMIQSFLALGGAGPMGSGLGEGRQKLFFLPEPHTEFIYAVVGEELGLAGTGAILLLFAMFLWRGWRVALATPDPFGRLLAFGLTGAIALAAALNMGVVTGLLPTKGLPLPFVSYGGSSLVVNLFAVGMLFNISRQRGVR